MRLPVRLLRRKINSCKNDFGHILIIAGSASYSGAALLTAEAVMRAGAGLVTLGIPKSLNIPVIKRKLAEVITLPLPETKEGNLSLAAYKKIINLVLRFDVIIIGPGLGSQTATKKLVNKVLLKIDKPVVIDADGLNALADNLKILSKLTSNNKSKVILTPHPGEMARLLKSTTSLVQANRKRIAQQFSRQYKVTLVLKGHNTIVADNTGNFYINKTGNPGMSSAGSGDVLTGMIGAFLGQGLKVFEAAKLAVYLHGLAGDLAAQEKTQISLIASDIIGKIPEAIKKCS